MQMLSIPCRGGLDLSSNNHELLKTPGVAIDLVNFECSKEGGYRRINGYTEVTTEVPTSGTMYGVINYKGILACRGDTIQHTEDNVNWTEVATGRTGVKRYMFRKHYYAGKEYVYMVDGVNEPAVFSIDSLGVHRFAVITGDPTDSSTPLMGTKYCALFKNQLVLAGMDASPTSIFYSSVADTDFTSPEDDNKETPLENFDGATSGVLDFGDIVTGIKTHRETLFVFCQNSIFRVTGLDSGQVQSIPVTRDIGCIDGFTIQEVGGDLLFLAPDGLRTIAKTERLDDIEMGTISRKVGKLLDPRISQKDRFNFQSTVIREKNQYRLWYTDPVNPLTAQRGLIASYTYISETNSFEWCFSEMLGLSVSSVDNSYHEGKERIIHVNHIDSKVMLQESGSTFNGARIFYVCQLAFSDYGDLSIRKNIHKAILNSRAEGAVEMGLELRYDYNHNDVFQPLIYPLERMTLPAIFGRPNSIFGDSAVLFGATTFGDTEVYTEGSGFVVSLRIRSLDTIDDSSFDLQSFQIDLTAGGKI